MHKESSSVVEPYLVTQELKKLCTMDLKPLQNVDRRDQGRSDRLTPGQTTLSLLAGHNDLETVIPGRRDCRRAEERPTSPASRGNRAVQIARELLSGVISLTPAKLSPSLRNAHLPGIPSARPKGLEPPTS